MDFRLQSDFKPTGDQPKAIKELITGVEDNIPFQTLLGVTGSGKTFTIANVIQEVKKPTLILSHTNFSGTLYGESNNSFQKIK